MTPNTTTQLYRNELLELAEREADFEYNTLIDAATSRYSCPMCASNDGTVAWPWFEIETGERHPEKYERPDFFLRYKNEDYALFTPCDACNPSGIIQPGYSRVEYAEALEWVSAQKEANSEEVAWMKRMEEQFNG